MMATNQEHMVANSLVKEYLEGATVHGFSQLMRAKNIASRVIWLISITGTASVLSYMVYYCYKGWEANPAIIAVAPIPIEKLVFPPVTICPVYDSTTNDSIRLTGNSEISEFVWTCSFQRNGIDEGKVCNRIQIISSEHGFCITFNNVDITLRNSDGPIKVPGVGKTNGLQLRLNPEPFGVPVEYRIFVSEIGTTYSKVFFDIDVEREGEINFSLHGIHFIESSKEFEDWNRDKMACLFPYQKKLAYFSAYMQANCKLECAWNSTVDVCGCAPKGLALPDIPICNTDADMECWDRTLVQIKNEGEDPKCKCGVNCEMHHFFFSMREVEPEELINFQDPQEIQELPTINGKKSCLLYFYFDTHITLHNIIQLRLSFFDKVGSLGGLLGVFSGISLMSVIELLYYIYLGFVMIFSPKSVSSEQTSPAPVSMYPTKN